MKDIADRIVQFRWVIIIGFIAFTVVFASQIPRAKIDSNLKSMLPTDMESRVNTDKIDEIFGGTDMLMIVIKADDVLNLDTLRRVKNISKQMKRVKGVDKVMSLFEMKSIKGEEEAMIVNPAVKRIPRTEEQKEALRRELMDNDMVYGSVISEDFTVTAVIALLKSDVLDDFIVSEVEKLVKNNPGPEEVIIGGLPNLRVQVAKSIGSDLRRFLPLGLLIMLIFLYICFKQMRGVLLPFFVVIMTIVVSMGLIPLLGWKIQVITVILPVILIAIANDYGIHLIARYQELNLEGSQCSKKELAKRIFRSLSKPVLLTGLTTVAGMLCLLGHIILAARQLGILAASGIVFALAASLFFIPAVVSFLPTSKKVIHSSHKSKNKPILERLLAFFGNFVSKYPKVIVAGSLVMAVFVSVGIFFVVVDSDPNKYYPKDNPIVYTAKLINESLGGAQNISVVYEGDIKNPKILKKIDRVEREIEKIPEVGKTTSIARVVRQMSRALNKQGEEFYDVIPESRNAVAQYFELYAMSGDPEDFEKLVDFPYENAIITTRLKTASTAKLDKIIEQIEEIVKNDQDVKLMGGFGLILSELSRVLVNGQFLSLGLAICVVGVLIMILFRSVTAGLISAIPLSISVMSLFGLMGIFGIELNIATAMLSSIMIGVGVDYTIHILWRYKEERKNALLPRPAVRRTLTTTGRGIIFNALSVIVGFVILLISSFMPVRFFGFLVFVSIFTCLMGALVLIPSLCLILKPKFLEPK